MSTYKPAHVPERPEEIPAFLREELSRLARELSNAQPEFTLQILHATPTKTWAGQVIYVDGTDFNPGSGAGVYRRNAANSGWVFLG